MAIENSQRIIQMRDTKANITALTGSLEEAAIAYTTDTSELGIYTGGAWVWLSIAAANDEKVKVSANDTTAGYLNGKLVSGAGITLTENNDGGNETLTIASSVAAFDPDTILTDDDGNILVDDDGNVLIGA